MYAGQAQRLVAVAAVIHHELYGKFDEVLRQKGIKSPYVDSDALEECAAFLSGMGRRVRTLALGCSMMVFGVGMLAMSGRSITPSSLTQCSLFKLSTVSKIFTGMY